MPTRAKLALALAALCFVAADREHDQDERAVVRQWLLENAGECREREWSRAVDYGMSADGLVIKNFRVLRVYAIAKKDKKVIDRVFVVDPLPLGYKSSQAWNEIKLNQPTAESWYREEFEKLNGKASRKGKR